MSAVERCSGEYEADFFNLRYNYSMSQVTIDSYLKKITLPDPNSHKGQNGKVLVIGGSELFHSASRWCLDTVSKLVDMVFYCSVPGNNELIKEAKGAFWNGIVVEREQCESYLKEADVIVIGPGMTRAGEFRRGLSTDEHQKALTVEEWHTDTARVINFLLATYPSKKWVIDAGALQMVDPHLLSNSCIITPHHSEFDRLEGLLKSELLATETSLADWLAKKGVTVLLKGPTDYVYAGSELIEIKGGNAGMTKGGTGDVLAGLVAGLYTRQDAVTSTVVGSYVNKQSGEELWKTVGPFFNATDLVEQIPKTLWSSIDQN